MLLRVFLCGSESESFQVERVGWSSYPSTHNNSSIATQCPAEDLGFVKGYTPADRLHVALTSCNNTLRHWLSVIVQLVIAVEAIVSVEQAEHRVFAITLKTQWRRHRVTRADTTPSAFSSVGDVDCSTHPAAATPPRTTHRHCDGSLRPRTMCHGQQPAAHCQTLVPTTCACELACQSPHLQVPSSLVVCRDAAMLQ